MRLFGRWAIGCVLLYGAVLRGQTRSVRVCVRDASGAVVAGASVGRSGEAGGRGATDASGCALLQVPRGARVSAERTGFATASGAVGDAGEVDLILQAAGVRQQVEVTAARVPLALDASASSVRVMQERQLEEAPGFALDDRLRQVAGFQLFRRTGSWVANPTTQGTSLRGLGSTAASRTLVLSDQVPLNDAFGGWVHWNEIPQMAVRSVELVRGGASDLYGSSAIGGVIDVVPVTPERTSFAADLAGATEDTSLLNGLATSAAGRWTGLAAVTLFRTGGYVLTAPAARGAVDVASHVHSQSGRIEARRAFGSDGSAFVRGNLLNEARGNGTRLQTNGTRLWRYAAGADWTAGAAGRLLARGYGDDQGYRQSFSSIAANRASEQLTRTQRAPSQQIGGALQWAKGVRELTLVAGSDVQDTRAKDVETPISRGVAQATVNTSARQRDAGVYGEILWQRPTGGFLGGWSVALSSRVDRFQSFDATQFTGASGRSLPSTDETVFDPRLGVVKQVGRVVSVSASGFRAFRGPTMNELYRTGQVGQQTTQANPSLKSERATGYEIGELTSLGRMGSVRASYFWTQVNRPVAAVAVSSTATTQLLMRRNLGQLESRGVTAEWEMRPLRWMELVGGYQYALSTVTRFEAQPALVGRWTPQVPRNSATAQVRMERRGLGVLAVDGRVSGRQYDDSENVYELHGFAQVNVYAEHGFGRRAAVYASVQNLLNRSIDAGRTPVLTVGTPRVVMAGVRWRSSQ